MVRKKSKKKVLPLLVIISAIIFTGLIGAITFQNIFPTTTPYVTNESTVNLSYGIHAGDGLSSITHSWNGTNTTLYDYQLVAFYNFDNRSALGENDTIVKDISMYGNNGTIVGGENITWTANGKYGGAFNFSGNTNYISTPVNLTLLPKSNFTISFFFKTSSSSTTNTLLGTSGGFLFRYNNAGNPSKFQLYPNLTTYASWNVPLMNGTWYYLTLIIDQNNNNAYLYVNGSNKGNRTIPYDIGYNSLLNLGAWSTQYMNGSIDDLMIFNRSLSVAEINQLYLSQITKYNGTYFEYNTTINNSANSINSFICSKNATAVEFCTTTQIIRQVNTIKSNFSTLLGIYNGKYGATVGGDWYGNAINSSSLSLDYSWGKNALLSSKIGVIYLDMYEDNWVNLSNGSFSLTGIDASFIKSEVEYARENNIKVFLVGKTPSHGMPESLKNVSSDCNTYNNSCPPINYTQFANLQLEVIKYYTNNGEYLDTIEGFIPFNEPHAQLFKDLSTSIGNQSYRASVYYSIWNESRNVVKGWNSSIKVGGPSGSFGFGTDNADYVLWDWWFSNMSNFSDFTDVHIYRDDDLSERFSTKFLTIQSNCSTYYPTSTACSNIYVTEFNIYNNTLRNETQYYSKFGNEIADFYSTIINQPQNNISTSVFAFGGNGLNGYGMIDDVGLFFKPSYNVTKNFAHLCPAGASVFVSSNDDDTIKQVACSKGSMYSLIVINTDTNEKNVTANLSLTNGSVFYPYTSLMNYEDGSSIPVSTSGIAQLGVLDSYEVLYLTSGDEDGASQTNFFKFNEATGTRVYDLLQNVTYGTISGATWVNDSIFKTLTSAIDYTISTSGLLVVSSSYLFNYMNASWSYLATWRDTGSTASLVMVDSLGNSTTFLSILIVISFAVVILTLFKPSVNTNPLGKPHY